MTPKQIVETLGVPIEVDTLGNLSDRSLGDAPGAANLVETEHGVVIRLEEDTLEQPEGMLDALHEALHALIGPASFDAELGSGLMAAEWALCQELDAEMYPMWRRIFSDYGIGDSFIGDRDDFLTEPLWIEGVEAAKARGFLTDDGRFVWGHEIHPDTGSSQRRIRP